MTILGKVLLLNQGHSLLKYKDKALQLEIVQLKLRTASISQIAISILEIWRRVQSWQESYVRVRTGRKVKAWKWKEDLATRCSESLETIHQFLQII